MPYTTVGPDSYWIDDPIPTISNTEILNNRYLTTEGDVIFHPRWRYNPSSEVYVTDEYLFYNKGYLRVIETEPPNVGVSSTTSSYATQSPPSSWAGIGSTSVQVTWDFRENIPLPAYPEPIGADEDYEFVFDSDELYPVSITSVGISTDEFNNRTGILTTNLQMAKDALIASGYTGAALSTFNPNTVGLTSLHHSDFDLLVAANENHYSSMIINSYSSPSLEDQALKFRYESMVKETPAIDDII